MLPLVQEWFWADQPEKFSPKILPKCWLHELVFFFLNWREKILEFFLVNLQIGDFSPISTKNYSLACDEI